MREMKLADIGSTMAAPREALRTTVRVLRYLTYLSAIFCGLASLGTLLAGHRDAANWVGAFLVLLLVSFYVGQREGP